MIQRVQTIYMFLVAVLTVLIFAMPLASFMADGQAVDLTALGIKSADGKTIVSSLHMTVLISLAAVLPLVNIFLFKKRWVQIRLCLVQMILQLGVIVYFVFYIINLNSSVSEFQTQAMSLKPALIFPLVNIILSYLAYRGVVKDEALVRSLDRIR